MFHVGVINTWASVHYLICCLNESYLMVSHCIRDNNIQWSYSCISYFDCFQDSKCWLSAKFLTLKIDRGLSLREEVMIYFWLFFCLIWLFFSIFLLFLLFFNRWKTVLFSPHDCWHMQRREWLLCTPCQESTKLGNCSYHLVDFSFAVTVEVLILKSLPKPLKIFPWWFLLRKCWALKISLTIAIKNALSFIV